MVSAFTWLVLTYTLYHTCVCAHVHTHTHLFSLFQAIDAEVGKEIETAAEVARQATGPNVAELYSSIYCDSPGMPVRGCDPLTWGQHNPTTGQ